MNTDVSLKPNFTLETVEQLLLRFGLVASVIILWASITSDLQGSETVSFTLPVWLSVGQHVLGFAAILLAARRRVPQWASVLIFVLLLLVLFNRALLEWVDLQRGGVSIADTYLYPEYAAQLLQLGENPYHYDLFDAHRAFRDNQVYVTYLFRDGVYSSLAHPPLSFLVLLPLQWLGIPSNYVYVLFFVLTLALLFWSAPPIARSVILLPLFLNTDFFEFVFIGTIDIAWVFFLLLMIVSWRRPGWRAVWFGVACAVKTQPWLLGPFLLIRLWHENAEQPRERWRRIVEFSVISALTFLSISLPFILWDANAWLTATLSNYVADFIVFGQGLARVTMLGTVILPKQAFLILMLTALVTSLLVYARYYRYLPEFLWLVPPVLLWFGSHSLTSYWVHWYAVIVLVLAQRLWHAPTPATQPDRFPIRGVSFALAVPVGALVMVLGWFAVRPPALTVTVDEIVRTDDTIVSDLSVTVTNNSDGTVTPRFSLYNLAPFFWQIETGPETIAPGDSAQFEITGKWPLPTYFYRDGMRVAVWDAEDYSLRGVAFIDDDVTPGYPGVVPNGDFRYWQDGEAPANWELLTRPTHADALTRLGEDDAPGILRFTVTPAAERNEFAYTMLNTVLMFPEVPIDIWVKPPSGANALPDLNTIYGLELRADDKTVWVLFGDEHAQGIIAPDHYYWMRPTPRDAWSRQRLYVRDIFADLGLVINTMEREPMARFNHLNYPKTRLEFRLLLAARNMDTETLTAEFGTIHNTQLMPDRSAMVRDALEHPERILIWRGEQNWQNRNYAVALDYFDRALELAPDEARAIMLKGWVNLEGYADIESASENFEQARQLMISQSGRYDYSDLADTFAGSGWALLRSGACEPALDMFQQMVALEPNYPIPWFGVEECRTTEFGAVDPSGS